MTAASGEGGDEASSVRGAGRAAWFALTCGLTLSALGGTQLSAQRDTPFEPDCELAFQEIAVERPIDRLCGPAGSAGSARGKAQNRAKNDFCPEGPVVDLRASDFDHLQRVADAQGILRRPRGIPADRTPLRSIAEIDDEVVGEGRLVRFVGYLDHSFHAGINRGESVNCKLRGPEGTDIHIELAEVRRAEDCERVTAEISPHFRPAAWNVDVIRQVGKAKRPLRVTGTLFYDASHSPCEGGEGYRRSSWEVHPVLALEVCGGQDLERCRERGPWIALDRWAADEGASGRP